jgi:hypothetical protein
LKLIAEFEVASWKYLKDGVAVVLKVEDVVIGLVLNLDVSKSLSGEKTLVDAVSLEPLDEYPLSEFKV